MRSLLLFVQLMLPLDSSAAQAIQTDTAIISQKDTVHKDTATHKNIVINQKDTAITQKDTITTKKDSLVAPSITIPIKNKEENAAACDTITKKSGFAILGKVLEKNLFEIKYIKKGEKLERKISTRELKSVHYANGKFELIDNTPEKTVKKDWVTATAEVEWKRIKCVYKEVEVAGMIDKGIVEADYEAKKIIMGNDLLERNAIIILQKKAYTLKANFILITKKDIKREYGEIPSISMSARAYSKE